MVYKRCLIKGNIVIVKKGGIICICKGSGSSLLEVKCAGRGKENKGKLSFYTKRGCRKFQGTGHVAAMSARHSGLL